MGKIEDNFEKVVSEEFELLKSVQEDGTLPDDLFRLDEVEKHLKISRATMNRLLNNKELCCVRVGHVRKIRKNDLATYKARIRLVREGSEGSREGFENG